jgi:hypothetical protein
MYLGNEDLGVINMTTGTPAIWRSDEHGELRPAAESGPQLPAVYVRDRTSHRR